MICRIACPVQDPAAFSIENCTSCRHFDLHRGAHISVRCRKNRTPNHKRHFEMAYLSNYIGDPDTVVVEETEEYHG